MLPPEIWGIIMKHCTFESLARLAITNMSTRALVLRHLRTDLFARLSPYFRDIDAIFKAMRLANAIFYGSFLTSYLHRSEDWTCYSLGIAVSNDSHSYSRIHSALVAEGYVTEHIPRSTASLYEHGATLSSPQQRHHYISPGNGCHVHVFITPSYSALASLGLSWSTMGFTYMTPDFIFCAYPQLTLNRLAFFAPVVHITTTIPDLYARWLRRGVTFGAKHPKSNDVPASGRRFLHDDVRMHDDGGCLWLPLEVEGNAHEVMHCTERLSLTLPFSQLKWQWPTRGEIVPGSVGVTVLA